MASAPSRSRSTSSRAGECLEDNERELLLREAGLEADHEIRLQKLERREAAVAEREEKLTRREGDLGSYVAQVQEEMGRRESEWWGKQLGEPLGTAVST